MIGKCNTGGENVTAEVTTQTPIITEIANDFGVTITTPSGTNKQILQGNNDNLQSIKTNAKKEGQYVWEKLTTEGGDFVDFVVSDNSTAYPDGGEKYGYWYKLYKCDGGIPIEYEFTGSSSVSYFVSSDSDGNPHTGFLLKLLTSGTLKIKSLDAPITDLFLVGGGGGGGNDYSGAAGGGGGYTRTLLSTNIDINTNIPVVIGAGGAGGVNGGTTSISNNTVAGGYAASDSYYKKDKHFGGGGGNGGSGGGAGVVDYAGSAGTGQGTTTRAFGESSGELFSGGGGGSGPATTNYVGYAGGSDGGNGTTNNATGAGGAGGGAPGGNSTYNSAKANTGGGGGGGANAAQGTGGSGGSGIVILRGRYS